MEKQQAISASIQKAKVGKRVQVLVDTVEGGLAKGRTRADAPGIDGAAHVASRRPLRPGDLVTMKVERADAYDLWGSRGLAGSDRRARRSPPARQLLGAAILAMVL